MKKYFTLVTAALLAIGCNVYDDTALNDRVTNLENRVTALERLNDQVQSLNDLVKALQNNVYVTSVTPVMQSGVEVGYAIVFSDQTSVEILNGVDGVDGDPGAAGSVVSIAQDTDGIYYWQIDGEFTDPKLRVDGVTPQFEIDEDGYLNVSYDNGTTWESLGKTSASVEANFTVTYDEDYVYITFTDDGSVIELPREKEFTLTILHSLVGITAGSTVEIPYVLTDADETVIIETISENGYTATVEKTTVSEGVIKVTAPDPLVSGKVLVFAGKGDKTCMRALYFEEGEFSMATTAYNAVSDGEKLKINFNTNYSYTVEVPVEYPWITVSQTKAAQADSVYIYVLYNETGERRTGQVNFVRDDGELLQTVTVSQDPCEAEMIRALFGIQPTVENPYGFDSNVNRTMAAVGDYLILSNSNDFTKMPVYDRYTGDWLPDVHVNTTGIDANCTIHAIANDDAGHLVAVSYVSSMPAGPTESRDVRGFVWLNGIDQAPKSIIWANMTGSTFAGIPDINGSAGFDMFRTISVYGNLASGEAVIGTVSKTKYRPIFLKFNDGVMEPEAFIEWPANAQASFWNASKAVPMNADLDALEYFMCSANYRQFMTYVNDGAATTFSVPTSHWWANSTLGIDAIDINGTRLFAVQDGQAPSTGNYYFRLYVSDLGSGAPAAGSLSGGFLFDSREGSAAGTADVIGSGYGVKGMTSYVAFDGGQILDANGNETGDVIFAPGKDGKSVQVYMLTTGQGLIGYTIPFSKLQ